MSLRITRTGLLDTVQDLGRYGYQHLGINPGAVMDRFSAALANALLGKELVSPVIEMHFPAAQILFEKACAVCLTGADFSALINEKPAPLNQPFLVTEQSLLTFKGLAKGARCYLSVLNDFVLEKWLNSYGTNLKAGAGGFRGRKLEKGDWIEFEEMNMLSSEIEATSLPWKYNQPIEENNLIQFIPGPEWNWLTSESQLAFLSEAFNITPASDRMGYRLQGKGLEQQKKEQLVSSAVTFGTVQLLPNGQLILLMADHQTTGGYPRIATVIGGHLPKLAQMKPGESITFEETNLAAAERKLVAQQRYLQELQKACHQKMQNWLHAH